MCQGPYRRPGWEAEEGPLGEGVILGLSLEGWWGDPEQGAFPGEGARWAKAGTGGPAGVVRGGARSRGPPMPWEGAEATRLQIWHCRWPLVGGARPQPRIRGCFRQICWLRWHPRPPPPGLLPVQRGNGCVCSHTHGNSGATNHLHVQIPVSGEKHTNDSKCREIRNVHFRQLSSLHSRPSWRRGRRLASRSRLGLSLAGVWRFGAAWNRPRLPLTWDDGGRLGRGVW